MLHLSASPQRSFHILYFVRQQFPLYEIGEVIPTAHGSIYAARTSPEAVWQFDD